MSSRIYLFGEFRFVPSARELWRGRVRVELPRRTFECIEYLIAHRGRAIGRDELVDAIFGRANVSDAQLGQVVLRARRALDDDGHAQRRIRTVAGYGYRWVAEVRTVEADAHETPVVVETHAATSAAGGNPSAVIVVADAAPAMAMSRDGLRSRWLAGLACALLLVVAGAVAWSMRWPWRDAARTTADDSLIVLPLQVDGLREDGWVRLGTMDLVADRLREAGFSVPPSENVLGLLGASSPSAQIDAAALRAAAGVRLVVRGKAVRSASGWRVELAATRADGIAVPVAFAAGDPVHAARGASDLLLAALGRTPRHDDERDIELDETLQRARAAMLANELDTARTILTASPQLAQAPERLAFHLAQVDVRAGQLDRAEAALTRVLAQPATAGDARFHAQVLTARGSVRMRGGAFDASGRDFEAAIALLTPAGPALERGHARAGRANSRVAEHRYAEALADFAAARIDLESAGDALAVARVDANLGMLELYRGRPAAALGYLSSAADRFQTFGALHELLIDLTGLIDAQLALLQRDEAWLSVERAWALRERITDPDQRVDLLLDRAQVLMGLGRYREAAAAITQANASATSGNRVLTARLRALDAELAWRQGRWREAADTAAVALAAWPVAGADGDRAAVQLIRQRALLALGDSDAAAMVLDRRRRPPERAPEQSGSVADAIAMAEWSQHSGDTAAATRWFVHAEASADARGVPADIIAVARAYAPVLLAAGERERAVASIGRVAPWAARDFDCALLQLQLFHQLDQREPWFNALQLAQRLAGEREIPAAWLTPRQLDDAAVRLSERE
ncbi:MAG: winged helix-turn-helix domain-containing protein [Dokdonella sp.]